MTRNEEMVQLSFLCILADVIGAGLLHNERPIKENNLTSLNSFFNTTNPLQWINAGALPVVQNPGNTSQVISAETLASDLFVKRDISNEKKQSLNTWNDLQHLVSHAQVLPNALEATKEAGVTRKNLLASVEDEKLHLSKKKKIVEDEKLHMNESSQRKGKEKQCPHYLSKMNATELDGSP